MCIHMYTRKNVRLPRRKESVAEYYELLLPWRLYLPASTSGRSRHNLNAEYPPMQIQN